jgi:hypothetical protein
MTSVSRSPRISGRPCGVLRASWACRADVGGVFATAPRDPSLVSRVPARVFASLARAMLQAAVWALGLPSATYAGQAVWSQGIRSPSGAATSSAGLVPTEQEPVAMGVHLSQSAANQRDWALPGERMGLVPRDIAHRRCDGTQVLCTSLAAHAEAQRGPQGEWRWICRSATKWSSVWCIAAAESGTVSGALRTVDMGRQVTAMLSPGGLCDESLGDRASPLPRMCTELCSAHPQR